MVLHAISDQDQAQDRDLGPITAGVRALNFRSEACLWARPGRLECCNEEGILEFCPPARVG